MVQEDERYGGQCRKCNETISDCTCYQKPIKTQNMAKSTGKKQVVTIKSNEENPEPVELIAESIIKISDAFEKIQNSKLTRRAIILLLHDAIGSTKIGKKEIELVLDTVPKLKKYYTK